MKKHAYTIIPFIVLAGPFFLSFDQKVNFVRYWPAVIVSTLVVGAIYIVWDVIVTRRGHWGFNDEFVGRRRLYDLPVGEWLFFLFVPYAILFIYEVAEAYFGPGSWSNTPTWVPFVAAVPFALLAIIWRKREYTMLAFGSTSVFLVLSGFVAPGMVGNSVFWIFAALSLLAFVVVNGIYTSLPTIHYNPDMILGPRVGSIPLEDFFYNTSYLGLTFLVFLLAKSGFGIPPA